MKRPPRKRTRGRAGTLSLTHKPSLSYLLLLHSLVFFPTSRSCFPPQPPEAPTPTPAPPAPPPPLTNSYFFPHPSSFPLLGKKKNSSSLPLSLRLSSCSPLPFHIALTSASLWYIQPYVLCRNNSSAFTLFFIQLLTAILVLQMQRTQTIRHDLRDDRNSLSTTRIIEACSLGWSACLHVTELKHFVSRKITYYIHTRHFRRCSNTTCGIVTYTMK